MNQRVMIAMAVACNPRLLIADEPTTALDVTIQAQILDLLMDLRDEFGMGVIIITHNMGVIAETADRVAVMYAGRLVEIGPVVDVVRAPAHPYTRGLMGSIPVLGAEVARLVQIDGAMPRLTAIPVGCAFNPRCAQAFARCREARPPLMAAGIPISLLAWSSRITASPRATPGARLNDIITAGNWPIWAIDSCA